MSVQPYDAAGDALHYRGRQSSGVDTADVERGTCSCTGETFRGPSGVITVLYVSGEVDLRTLPVLAAALQGGFVDAPAQLVIDLAGVGFCSVRGLDHLVQAAGQAAELGIGYAVSGSPDQIRRVWTLLWREADLPPRFDSAAEAVAAARRATPRTG